MSFQEFQAGMETLRGLPFPPVNLQTHWAGLSDLDLPSLSAAVKQAARDCERFPSPAQLRELADRHRPHVEPESRVVPLAEPRVIGHLPSGRPIVQESVYESYCPLCDDQYDGWREEPGRAFGAPGTVVRCACWGANPVVIARRSAAARYAAQAKSGGHR